MLERKTVSQCPTVEYCLGWNAAVDAMPKWISVTEQMPDVGKTVICCANGWIPRITTGWYDAQHKMWRLDSDIDRIITHWMELPEPPKEE